ncbi:MAG: MFS transporter [Vicinamibacterales bacterium]
MPDREAATGPAAAPFVITRRAVVSWVLYDLANTIFSMGVVSVYFSLYVREAVGGQRADSVYGIITAVSMGIIFILSPLLGAMTDRAPRRMPFLVTSTLICCACTALFARGPFAVSAVLFVVANAAYQAGVQFYDAMLPEVTTEENRGRIGGIGVGVGYVGSYIAVGVGLLLHPMNYALYFTIVAGLFLLFAVPCVLFVRERGNRNPRPVIGRGVIRESTRQTIDALRQGQRYPGLLRFLVGRVFYTDAVNTVIAFMSLYTTNVAISTGLGADEGRRQAGYIMLSAISFAVAGGFAWGRVVDRIGPKRTLDFVLLLWMAIFATAAAIGFLRLPISVLYVVAALAGLGLGGTWSADRPYMLRLTPPDRVGEFYGLYGMVGRFSAITGPVLWAATTYLVVERGGASELTGQAWAILTLLAMVVASFVILRRVTDEKRNWGDLRSA